MSTFDQALWGQTVWGGDPGDPTDAAVKVGDTLDRAYPRLHASSAATLTWWTEAQLIGWLDRAMKRLARKTGSWVKQTSTATEGARATYDLPVDHVSTLQATHGTTTLRASSATEMLALDTTYQTASGTPKRWYEDTIGIRAIGLQPVPSGGGTLGIIHHYVPAPLSSRDSVIPAPEAIAVLLEEAMLGEAYGEQTDAQMPEVREYLTRKWEYFEQLFQQYFGVSQ